MRKARVLEEYGRTKQWEVCIGLGIVGMWRHWRGYPKLDLAVPATSEWWLEPADYPRGHRAMTHHITDASLCQQQDLQFHCTEVL